MPVDDCKHSFDELAGAVFPRYLAKLKERMETALSMADFAQGIGIRTLLQRLSLEDDFSGCYVLIDGTTPLYVGISRAVLSRLRQHVRGTTHFDASLAYLMAAKSHPHQLTRSHAMELEEFMKHFQLSQQYLRTLRVAFIEIENPLELYVFEAYAAMALETKVWNTFATH